MQQIGDSYLYNQYDIRYFEGEMVFLVWTNRPQNYTTLFPQHVKWLKHCLATLIALRKRGEMTIHNAQNFMMQ